MKKIYAILCFPLLLLNAGTMHAQGLIVTANAVNTSCLGSCDGSGLTTVSNGTAPYTYSWTPSGGTGANASNLCAGTYTVKVTDHVGVTLSKTITVAQPSGISIGMSFTNVTCNGNVDGSLNASVFGGTTAYTYSWSPSPAVSTTSTASSLPIGTYTVHVTDSHGCIATQTGIVGQPAPIAATSTSTNATCSGTANGTATVTVTGGNTSYSYSWSPSGGSSNVASGLAPGTYICHVNDYKGCATTSVVTITQPNPVTTVLTTSKNPTCYSSSNGTATVTPSGGTAPYTYSWSPKGGTATTATGLGPGSYTCFVNDANGCQANPTNVPLSQPPPLTSSIQTMTNVVCYGTSTGSATASASGGTGAFTYSWSPTGGNTAVASSIPAGTYTCLITDANGCPTNTVVFVSESSAVALTPAITQANCGSSNGSASVTVSGGGSPYTYSWASPVTSTVSYASSLPAGSYTVSVTDFNGCSSGATVITITNIGAPTGAATSTPNTCNGNAAGTASITPTGGTAPLTYVWSPSGGTASTASGLAAGSYSVTVKDANGCILTSSTTITDPPAITGTITSTNLLCNGGITGKASMTAAGGTGALSYTWSPSGGNTANAANLPAGTYTCVAKDANGCPFPLTTTLTQPIAVNVSFTQVNPTCFGSTNGSATATASGGVIGYSYSWSPIGGNTATGTGFSATTYTCTVTDGNGCISPFPVTLSNPQALASSISTANASCFGTCTGTANALPSGGTGTYSYSWSSGATAQLATNLCAGSYTCIITDANNCSTQTLATLTQPTVLTNILTPASSSCGGACDGSLAAVASGGTPVYSYAWSKNGQPVIALPNTVCSGTYTCMVTDAHGCIQTATTTVGASASPTILGTVIGSISGPINSGWAYLVQYDSILKRQHVIDSVTISNGKYLFNTSIGGKFLVYAEPNHTIYPKAIKTYSLKAVQWDSAAIIKAPCAAIDTANINMLELNPTVGGGSLAGTINKGIGYVARLTGPNSEILGEPIPGLDVNLEQHPSGIMVAHTTTDASGNYHFGNIAPGFGYSVFVDIPGLGMTSQYTRTISGTNLMFVNLNYVVDSAHIRPDSTFANSIINNSMVNQSVHVAPNPFNEQLTINYTLTEPLDVTMEIYNLLGERISFQIKNRQDTGDHSFILNAAEANMSQGTYILRITLGGQIFTKKIVRIP
jgi:hypothetical protein